MLSRHASVEGIAMRWEEQGRGVPLVLIHGIPTSPRLWEQVVPHIVGARCLAWEMVGYGRSIPEGIGRDISVARQADYLLQWLRHLGIGRAVLAGHDLGGGVAQIAAVANPGLCAGLFLTNAIGYDSWPIPSAKLMQKLGAAVRRLPNALFKPIFRSFFYRAHDSREQAAAAFEKYWPDYERHGGAGSFMRQVDALDTNDTLAIADRLPALNVPARVAWGTRGFQDVGYGERFARDLRAPLRRIEGASHFTPEDHPEVITEEINWLLEGIEPSGSRK
ncbi:MAG TPA: alpha/beta fold hydrolase [Woeseiaceae bacterium]|nr:alpha/beta fold hydrolase [Woeseiaceae bacterium]